MGAIKKLAKWGLISYIAAYMGLSGYAYYDFKTENVERIRKSAKNTLVVKNYKVRLEDKVKNLTIVGETHIYNYKESEFADKLVDKYDYVAMEGGGISQDDDFLMKITSRCFLPNLIFYGMGNGRLVTNPTTHAYAYHKGKTIFYMESGEDEFKNKATLGQRLALVGVSGLALATAPLSYFQGRDELIYGEYDFQDGDSLVEYAANVGERDSIMAKNIVKALGREEVDSLLCVMGKFHVPGVEEKLKDKIKIEERDASLTHHSRTQDQYSYEHSYSF
ncbi:MAG: hypothetical protein Q8N77_01785 [Nanoarchaeota archaeon]|nr:hypothetical protein [Nanoarchaeota archaeon]